MTTMRDGQIEVSAGDMSSNDPDRYDYLTERYTGSAYKGDRLVASKQFGAYLMQATGQLDPEGDREIVVTLDGKVVADCFFGPQPGNESHIEGAVQVHPHHRRRGIATAMYSWIEALTGKKMAPGAGHSNDAERLWTQPNRAFGALDEAVMRRGLVWHLPDTPRGLALAKKMADHTITAEEIVRALEPLGIWWGLESQYGGIEEYQSHAESEFGSPVVEMLSDLNDDVASGARGGSEIGNWFGGDVAVIFTAKRPILPNGEPWDPAVHNPAGSLWEGNSYLERGQRLEIVEIRYDAGDGYHTLRPSGIHTTAGPMNDYIPLRFRSPVQPTHSQMDDPRQVVFDRPALEDIEDLPGDIRSRLNEVLHDLQSGTAEIDAKHGELAGVYTIKVTPRWRAAFYLGVDSQWHCFWVGPHNYDEATKRWTHTAKTAGQPIEYYRLDRGMDFIVARSGGKTIGLLSIGRGTSEVQSLWVAPEFRRRGIATQLWKHGKTVRPGLIHSLDRTDEGDAWARAVGGEQHGGPVGERKYNTTDSGSGERHARMIDGLFADLDDPVWGPRMQKQIIRLAMPSWRDRGARPQEAEALIVPDTGRGRNNSFEVFLYGQPHARRSTLAEAKQAVEEIYGTLDWQRVAGDKEPHHDTTWGPTSMFNDADYYLVVDRLPRLGTTAASEEWVRYHGTSAASARDILRDGPRVGLNLTSSPDSARMYARYESGGTAWTKDKRKQGVVLEVRVRPEETKPGSYANTGTVPDHVVTIVPLPADRVRIPDTGRTASDTPEIYLRERALRDEGIVRRLTKEQATELTYRTLAAEGFPNGSSAEVEVNAGLGKSMVGWYTDTIPPTPLVVLDPRMLDEMTVLHECAHIIRNGPEMAGRSSTPGTDTHDAQWLATFERLANTYGSYPTKRLFRTAGVAKTIHYLRNPVSSTDAGDFGSKFGQDIEPAGRYMVDSQGASPLPGWESGSITFRNPLMLDWGRGGFSDPTNWKQVLHKRYDGKTGRALSEAIVADGYDGIITEIPGEYGPYGEIVDLTMFARKQATAADLDHWRPTGGMFGRGQDTLDPRVFDTQTEEMRPDIHDSVMGALDAYWTPQYGDWRAWAKVYLAGSGASYWWDSDADMDILIGVDLDRLREARPANKEVADDEILAHLNKGLTEDLRPTTTTLNGFVTTFFVNAGAYDIHAIHPYAAYDLTGNVWVVKPPVLPANWGPDSIPEETWRRCEMAAREAQAVLALDEPERSIAGRVYFDWVHEGRRASYSAYGGGWLDAGNVIYQYLSQHPERLLRRLYLCKHPEQASDADIIEVAAASKGAKVSPSRFGLKVKRNVEYPRVTGVSEMRRVPLDRLATDQTYVYKGQVETLAKVPREQIEHPLDGVQPEGLDMGDYVLLTHGNHRAAAAHVRGDMDFLMNVWKTDRSSGGIGTVASTGSLPPGYSLRVTEEAATERWGLPKVTVDVMHDGKRVGMLAVFQRLYEGEAAPVGIPNIWVNEEHQRKGLATAMYAEVKRRWPNVPIRHSEDASDAAKALNRTLATSADTITAAKTIDMTPPKPAGWKGTGIYEMDLTGASTHGCVATLAEAMGMIWPIGWLTWDKGTHVLEGVWVEEGNRGNGIAKDMLEEAEKIVGGKLGNSGEYTAEGYQWAKKRGRNPVRKVRTPTNEMARMNAQMHEVLVGGGRIKRLVQSYEEHTASKTAAVQTYYHGTWREFVPGETLVPADEHGGGLYPSRGHSVYITSDWRAAIRYAQMAADQVKREHPGAVPRVYEVTPEGEVVRDDSPVFTRDEFTVPRARVVKSASTVAGTTTVYRAEHRPPDADLSHPESIGVHWTTKPLDYGYQHEPGWKRVVWHGEVTEENIEDASDRFNEGEVVIRNGGVIHLTGRTERMDRGYVDVAKSGEPEIPMSLTVPVKGRRISKKTAGLLDDLPKPLGETPVPSGTIRCYHYTSEANADSIARSGLLERYARGDGNMGAGNEASAGVWAATGRPASSGGMKGASPGQAIVEFWVKPEQVSQRAEYPFNGENLVSWGNGGYHHIIVKGDVPPRQIVAIHLPWHNHARYMQTNPRVVPSAEAAATLPLEYRKAYEFITRHQRG